MDINTSIGGKEIAASGFVIVAYDEPTTIDLSAGEERTTFVFTFKEGDKFDASVTKPSDNALSFVFELPGRINQAFPKDLRLGSMQGRALYLNMSMQRSGQGILFHYLFSLGEPI